MPSIAGRHTFSSALRQFSNLINGLGYLGTLSVLVSVIEDYYLNIFDRRYGVRTSGYISLDTTSVDPSKLSNATIRYRAVNAWAFRKLLNTLRLPKTLHFADFGCGLGRACILAAEYGFAKVTGIEFAPELCEIARENFSAYQRRVQVHNFSPPINLVQGDVLEYCDRTDDDVFFMYRPFSRELLRTVLGKLAGRANQLHKALTIIYSERTDLLESYACIFSENQSFKKFHEFKYLGQIFYVYHCRVKPIAF